ncbi:hypothetical protein VTK26DRAFT_6746 [Humicola hyalothermophila]
MSLNLISHFAASCSTLVMKSLLTSSGGAGNTLSFWASILPRGQRILIAAWYRGIVYVMFLVEVCGITPPNNSPNHLQLALTGSWFSSACVATSMCN